jgi:hypothetical protein
MDTSILLPTDPPETEPERWDCSIHSRPHICCCPSLQAFCAWCAPECFEEAV